MRVFAYVLLMSFREYRPDIDGLRAVAVIAVILFHANLGLPGGYVGVDVFFVISGFLITSLILQELSTGRFSLAGFWDRRIRRIFPASAVVISCTLAVGVALLLPTDLKELVKSAMAQMVLGANVFFWRNSGYFDGPAELKPLLHTWSLAVEEQFYLGFPLLLIACRRLSHRRMQLVLCALFVISFLLSVAGTYVRPIPTFYLLPTRAWELMCGALLATASSGRRISQRAAEPLSWLALASIFVTFWIYGKDTRFPGVNALLPCAATALFIWSNTSQRTSAGKLLSLKPVVFVGLISYSLYLWHWPVLVYVRYRMGGDLSLDVRIAAIFVSVILACLSWRYVEIPFRRRSGSADRRIVFTAAMAVTGALLFFAAGVWQLGGLPQRFPQEVLRFTEESEFPSRFETRGLKQIESDDLPIVGDANSTKAPFLLWGDSHAPPVAAALESLAPKYKLLGFVAACPDVTPVLGTWRPAAGKNAVEWNQAVVSFVRRKHIKNVILASDWARNIEGRENGSMDSLIVDDERQVATTSNAHDVLRRGLARTVEALRRAGATVWIMRQVPIQRTTPVEIAFAVIQHNQKAPEFGVTLAEHSSHQMKVDQILNSEQLEAVHFLDPVNVCFNSSGSSLISEDGRSYYFDRTHLSSFGATRLLAKLFEPVLEQIARKTE